ncbi:MAG: hypothetical protein D3909_01495 [Candidatus Electrothrix sp. ATG1]|nr:hypothetical protein [Candidatus Electrothrix sp. ATG1]
MMLTVLVLVTLISGASILISYIVIDKRVRKDLGTKIFNTESVAKTCFELFSRQLFLTAKGVGDELILRQMQAAGVGRPLPAMFRSLKGEKNGDVLFLVEVDGKQVDGKLDDVELVDGELISFSEKNFEVAKSLARHRTVQKKMVIGQTFSTIVLDDSGTGMEQQDRKRFYMIAAVPVILPYSSRSFFIFSCYLMDSSFLLRFPIYSHMDITLVSDNSVVATTLPPENYPGYPFYKSSVLLPGAIDFIHESSFFKERCM